MTLKLQKRPDKKA